MLPHVQSMRAPMRFILPAHAIYQFHAPPQSHTGFILRELVSLASRPDAGASKLRTGLICKVRKDHVLREGITSSITTGLWRPWLGTKRETSVAFDSTVQVANQAGVWIHLR